MASAVALSSCVAISRRSLRDRPAQWTRAPSRCRVAGAAVSETSGQSRAAEEVGREVRKGMGGVRKGVVEGAFGAAGRVAVAEEGREGLSALYDDGFGRASVKDYLDLAREMIKPNGGGPRWFCPLECGAPLEGSPLLLFLPGADGVGLGLILHHRSLGKT